MPRPVVPMAFAPCAFSRARSSATCEARINGHDGLTLQPLEHRHALADEHLGLLEQRLERQHHAVADQALHVRRAGCRTESATGWSSCRRSRACARRCGRPGSAPRPAPGRSAGRRSCPCPRRPTAGRSRRRSYPLRAIHSNARPPTMLTRPPQRSCADSVCASFAISRWAAAGFKNGRMPSSTRYSANAPAKIARQFAPADVHRRAVAGASAAACGCLKYLK